MLTLEQSTALAALERARQKAWQVSPWSSDRVALEAEAQVAWQQVRHVFPAEAVIALDDVPSCDAGAPMPVVLSDAHHTWVSYYVAADDERAVLRFDGVNSSLFGGPNDEALHGHRLSSKGLDAYRFHEVIGSEWISARERENSVHPGHGGGWHARLRHFVFMFHDETFECIARSYAVQLPSELPDPVAITLSMDGFLTG